MISILSDIALLCLIGYTIWQEAGLRISINTVVEYLKQRDGVTESEMVAEAVDMDLEDTIGEIIDDN